MTYDPKQVKKGVGQNAMSKIAIINLIVFKVFRPQYM